MKPWVQELRALIRNGGPRNRAQNRRQASIAAAHVPNRAHAASLEESLTEALDMIPVADEFGYGDFARQQALGFVDKIAAAESAAGDAAGAEDGNQSSETPPRKQS